MRVSHDRVGSPLTCSDNGDLSEMDHARLISSFSIISF